MKLSTQKGEHSCKCTECPLNEKREFIRVYYMTVIVIPRRKVNTSTLHRSPSAALSRSTFTITVSRVVIPHPLKKHYLYNSLYELTIFKRICSRILI